MDFKQEDDFWNATSGHSFVFDDEDVESNQLQEDNDIFHSNIEVSNHLPLQSIISPDNLKLVLDDVLLPSAVSADTKTMQLNDLINKLCLGQDCSLQMCKSQEDKLYLLDRAIKTCDGNVILKVVLFVVSTLKKNIAFRHLVTRPVALQQYSNYLASLNKLEDLHILYMATGNIKHLSNLFYLSIQHTTSSNVYKKLTQFNIEHLDSLEDDFERSLLQDHKRFLDYKLENNLPEEISSPSTALAHLCMKKLDKLCIDDPDLQHFTKLTKISPFKNEWIMINTIAANERWPILGNIFETQKWFNLKGVGKNSSRKHYVGIETIVICLHRHGAPRSILEDFLKRMDDSDHALFLGMRYDCHSFVIDTLSGRRDRVGLMEYKSSIINKADWIRVIDKTLLSEKKWVN